MKWSGIPAAISVDSATVMEDDWSPEQAANCIGPKLIYESCGQYPELSTTVLCLSLFISWVTLNSMNGLDGLDDDEWEGAITFEYHITAFVCSFSMYFV